MVASLVTNLVSFEYWLSNPWWVAGLSLPIMDVH